ncbi:YhgE/Pip domain-containing protein [Carnobacterium maltaromaticum]|uniref:YhgE/Pip domain-containing protein n=2 Tax=Carnobacterium TaxID=2747 RepID=UPI001A02909D|nr:YhgE/Pip domain-containing protein [Carnobacterium maltaromaticum]CAD5901941.1 YhgE/Pip C-terminal domain protein [Carnobacterium maltaromaticum]
MSMEMMKNEWKKLVNNKILLISFIVILFIPILYAAFFLKSVWDPYGKTGELPVAVVNMDKSVDYEGKTLDVGDQLVENLKKNELLDWHFVSQKQAEQGMKDKKYYMVVTLPENFSKNASTLLDKNPKKMNITYETNGSLNYIGEVIGETAAKQLQSEVSANVTKAYAESIFAQIEKVGDGFTQAADGSKKLQEGSTKLNDGNKTITENLQKLATSTITFSDGANKLEVGLDQYTDGVTQLNDGATKLNDGIGQLASNVGPLQAGVGQLSDGSQTLANGVGAYTTGVSQLMDGSNQLVDKNGKLNVGINDLSKNIALAQQTFENELLPGVQQMSDGITASPEDLNKLSVGLTTIGENINQLAAAVNDSSKSDAVTSAITADMQAIQSNLETNGAELQKLAGNVNENPEKTLNALKSTEAYDQILEPQRKEIETALENELNKQKDEELASIASIGNNTTKIGASLQDIQTQLGNLAQLSAALKTGVNALNDGTKEPLVQASKAAQGLGTIKAKIDAPEKGLLAGVTQLNSGLKRLSDGSTTLNTGIQQYTAGVDRLQSGAKQLTANSGALNAGANALNGGIGQISGKLPELISGVTQLNDGSSQLAAGTGKLTENSPQLKDGIGQLASGATQIQSGSGQLADGSKTLGDGLGTLNSGTKELSTKLGDGAKEVNGIKATDKTFDMLASPDKLTHKEFSHVDNYGAALAPYVMSLALYVGSLVFNFIFPIRKISMEGQSSRAWWLSKFSIGTVVAIAMAVIEVGIMLVLGLNVQSVGQMFTMAIVTSLAYMFIIMFLAMTFDNPGRFVAMVLLIVQLGGAGGTFPMPLTNGFFNAIHPFLPMSHSIYGFREAISGGLGQGTFNQSVFILVAIFVVFSGLLMVSMNWLQKRHLDDVSQLDNNQKLQAVEE